MEIADVLLSCFSAVCNLYVMSMLNDPIDLVRAAAVSHYWRHLVIENGLCKRLFFKRFPRITQIAYEDNGRYYIIRLSDVLTGDIADWESLERDHRIYSHLLQPQSKLMNCPRDCILFPVGNSSTRSIAEDILTCMNSVCTYPVGFSFLSSERQSETRIDFLEFLEKDVVIRIMSFLNVPADVVRASIVSHSWRKFVIENSFAKKICLKVFPHVSSVANVLIGSVMTMSPLNKIHLEREHMAYASLLHAVANSMVQPDNFLLYGISAAVANSMVQPDNFLLYGISASTTDDFPAKNIGYTMYPVTVSCYWSSKGHTNPNVPEALLYKLKSRIALITDIYIKPYEDLPQNGIFSAKFIRFRMGHPKSEKKMNGEIYHLPVKKHLGDEFVWMYTSPEFPMKQECLMQHFKLPEAALCMGGYVQIELLGRVQRHQNDGLFYICVDRVLVKGRSLYPAFDTRVLEGKILLSYHPHLLNNIMYISRVDPRERDPRPRSACLDRLRLWERMGFPSVE